MIKKCQVLIVNQNAGMGLPAFQLHNEEFRTVLCRQNTQKDDASILTFNQNRTVDDRRNYECRCDGVRESSRLYGCYFVGGQHEFQLLWFD